MWDKKNILAFVHIEKSAGTSLIHILRRNFFLRHLDVRPLSNRSHGDENSKRIFTAHDMKKSLRINPFLRCIAGHSVVAYGDLQEQFPQVRYITLLRDPVARYISQYKYWIQVLKHEHSFEEFLDIPRTHNFQTLKIAGCMDVEKAKESLNRDFFLVGVVDRFDEFLVQLEAKLKPRQFDTSYVARNVGAQRVELKQPDFDSFGDAIRERNALDMELYDYTVSHLLPGGESGAESGATDPSASARPVSSPGAIATVKSYVDGACRKAYYEPVTGLIRRLNNMPTAGSY